MEERKPRRKRGPSAFGNFDHTKAIAEEVIRERREADARGTLPSRVAAGRMHHCPSITGKMNTWNKLASRDVPSDWKTHDC